MFGKLQLLLTESKYKTQSECNNIIIPCYTTTTSGCKAFHKIGNIEYDNFSCPCCIFFISNIINYRWWWRFLSLLNMRFSCWFIKFWGNTFFFLLHFSANETGTTCNCTLKKYHDLIYKCIFFSLSFIYMRFWRIKAHYCFILWYNQ